jgi:3-oxoacyl-[acyl-carrier protein] reductase
MDLNIADKTYLIAGSSRGIGLGIAKCFLEEGAKVVITGRDDKSLLATYDALNALYPNKVMSLQGNLGDKTVIVSHIRKIICNFDRLDGVVANIGSGREPPHLPDDDFWEHSYKINLKTSLLLAKEALCHIQKQVGGTFTFIGSIAGIEDLRAPIAYSIHKAALQAASKMLSREFAGSGTRINIVAPGNIFFEGGSWAQKMQDNPANTENYIKSEVPLQCFGTPEDVGNICTFLASDKAKFITGSVIVVDGGQTRSW